jgi:putative heme-binding domain-containing protein
MRSSLVPAVALVLLTAAAAFSQNVQDHAYASDDVQAGARLYAAQCTGCHGPNGETVPGVDFRRGLFRRSSSDDDLAKVITTGVAGSGMPAFKLLPADVTAIVAYIRAGFDLAGPPVKMGNLTRGREHVEGKGKCLTCHRLNGRGLRTAPDLSDIGAVRAPSAIQRTLLDPTAGMMPINRPVRAVMKNGRTIRGRRLNEDTFTIQIMDEEERLLSLAKSDLKAIELDKTSPMPPATTVLSADEVADVVAYLSSLKGL